jgi:hypothetical protein
LPPSRLSITLLAEYDHHHHLLAALGRIPAEHFNFRVVHWRAVAKPPRRPPPQKRKSNLPAGDAVATRAIVPKKRDPRQSGMFDAPLPAFVRPQFANLVTQSAIAP